MKVLVLGAGIVGTTSAWYLARAGYQVTVLERQAAAGMETSFANGGQISVSHAEPWANPHAITQFLHWFGKEDAPLLFHPRLDADLFRWGLEFLRECLPSRTQENIRAIVNLALYSRNQLQELRRTLGHDFGENYNCLQKGILHIYTNPQELARAARSTRLMQSFGLDRKQVDADTCVTIEPSLNAARPLLAGGDYTASDESGDAHRFTQSLAKQATDKGVNFFYNTTINRLLVEGGAVTGVEIQQGTETRQLTADVYVLALGSYSSLFMKPYGIRLPVYPAKGYSATLELGPDSIAPSVSLTDDEYKLVFSRLGNRLRIAGTAEFNGYNLELNPVRCEALIRRVNSLFPELNPVASPQFWCGLRPATPSNRPLVGTSPLKNLWLNTGHGTLGWTMSCGSGAALADLIQGRRPDPDFPFC